jgi:hypothetical protein
MNMLRAPVASLEEDDAQLPADEARYSSFGDTVHYVDPPKIFHRCEGSYMFDGAIPISTCRCGTRPATSATRTSA